jgi:hypothetical protein
MDYSTVFTESDSIANDLDEMQIVKDTEADMTEQENEEKHLQILMAVVPIVVPILFTLIIIIGFIGNLLVILVVILNKTMRNTTNILIFNLAVSQFQRSKPSGNTSAKSTKFTYLFDL